MRVLIRERLEAAAPRGEARLAWREEILPRLAPELRAWLERVDPAKLAAVEELRLRSRQPVQLVFHGADAFLSGDGRLLADPAAAPALAPEVLRKTWQIVCEASVYSWEDETRQGFLTLPGGHRVGIAGRTIAQDGRVLRLRDVASLNVRLARERQGCADAVLPWLLAGRDGRLPRTLIYAPPGCGKTTLLRDLVRQVSGGRPELGLPGLRVALVDERGELAACRHGVPQHDLGPRTDVLDRCPKAAGILMALRSLNPQVIVFDELGGEHDARAVLEAVHAGVCVLTTVHASSLAEAAGRPALGRLFRPFRFEAWIGLGRRDGRPGVVVDLGRAGNRDRRAEGAARAAGRS